MPVRFRITILFSLFAFFILSFVCGAIYYSSYQSRLSTISKRLTNRAITTARLLSQKEIFDLQVVRRIDSLTTLTLKNKAVQAYDYQNRKIYSYSDKPRDTVSISEEVLDNARVEGSTYFTIGGREAVAYFYTDENARLIVVSAGEDVEGKQNLATLRKIMLSSLFAGFVLVLIGGYLFSSSLLQPIKKISTDVKAISAQSLARRIKTGSNRDEWYELTDTLNQLLNRLQDSFEMQGRFISNASHELSTPLTAILSQLEVSLQREREISYYKNVMHSIYQDVQHMNSLTQTLLQFAKASGTKGGLNFHSIRVDEIILRLPAEVAKINAEYVIELRFDQLPEDESGLLVFGNEALLLTAVKNIVLNACKYSDNKSAVVSLRVDKNSLEINIADKGVGIPPDKLEAIFEPFYRLDLDSHAEGFGLGLSLARRIIKLHKGIIKVVSEVSKGTVFSIVLPAAEVP